MPSALVSDFDGTITGTDFFSLVAERYMPSGEPDYFERYRAGEITHLQAMQAFFRWTPSDHAALEEILRDTQPDPDLKAACDHLDRAGWQLIIVSAGSSWYIERILDQAGITTAIVHANPGRVVPGQGLQLHPPPDERFFSRTAGIDKSAVMRDALQRYKRVAFAGDGPPDLAPALLTQPGDRFARRWLAEELTRQGEAFRPFEQWSAIVDTLLSA